MWSIDQQRGRQQEVTCKASWADLEGCPTGPVSVALCLKRQTR